MKKIIFLFFLIILIALIIIFIKILWETKGQVTLDLDYLESTDSLRNPERGWYNIHGYMISDNDMESIDYDFKKEYLSGDALVLLLFNLQNYKSEDISSQGLENIETIINKVRSANLKAIIRFTYDWDGEASSNEPENIQMIYSHMEQLQTIFHDNKDVIYVIQGVFIGNYGEMNNSQYSQVDNVKLLMDKLLEFTPNETKLAVRTPEFWRLICDTDEAVNSLEEYPGARISLYNDGLCSSETDLGTYSDGTGYITKWMRNEEIRFQSKLCDYVPNGGEIALESDYNDLENILIEFPQLHITYLNKGYNMEVLDIWKDTNYVNNMDPYDGLDGYKYIGDHLGYRFVLRETTVSRKIFQNINFTLGIEIENTGFGNVYYPKDVSLIFINTSNGEEIIENIKTDINTWRSGEMTKLKVNIPSDKLQMGGYKVYLKISGDNHDLIKLANNNIFDDKIGANFVGHIHIKDFSIKELWR